MKKYKIHSGFFLAVKNLFFLFHVLIASKSSSKELRSSEEYHYIRTGHCNSFYDEVGIAGQDQPHGGWWVKPVQVGSVKFSGSG